MIAGASMIFGANASFAGDWKPEKPITMVKPHLMAIQEVLNT